MSVHTKYSHFSETSIKLGPFLAYFLDHFVKSYVYVKQTEILFLACKTHVS